MTMGNRRVIFLQVVLKGNIIFRGYGINHIYNSLTGVYNRGICCPIRMPMVGKANKLKNKNRPGILYNLSPYHLPMCNLAA